MASEYLRLKEENYSFNGIDIIIGMLLADKLIFSFKMFAGLTSKSCMYLTNISKHIFLYVVPYLNVLFNLYG